MEIKEIYDLYKDYLDKEIVVKGWIRKHRKQKEIGFIDISDGTCFKKLQVVYDKDLSDFDKFTKTHFGSSVEVKGILQIKEDVIELKATEIKVIGDCDEDYPIQPKKHKRCYPIS